MKLLIQDNFPRLYKKLSDINYNIRYFTLKRLSPSLYKNYVKKKYKASTGQNLDFDNPINYTQKMQVAKLKPGKKLETKLTDKYAVREWVANKIGEEYLIPLLGVWDQFIEIEFDSLPNRFVLKATHGSGWNAVVEDKENTDYSKIRKNFDKWMKLNFFYGGGLETQYLNIKPRIIAEQFMEDENQELNDFKFLCFNGKVYYCWVDVGRYSDHYRNVYDLDWNLQPWNQHNYNNSPNEVKKPKNFEKMINIATQLCEGFSHVRVDLYNVDGRIYFGEMTFTNSSGYELIHPEEYNIKLGKLWNKL
ncbi:glycosyltransferase [Aerococcaceae bacterium DSM 111176]|nr:glycosyltransferase [Aerococcaceae bacterium DSM 111176]